MCVCVCVSGGGAVGGSDMKMPDGASHHALHVLFMASAMAPELSHACQQLQVRVCVCVTVFRPFCIKQHDKLFFNLLWHVRN